MASAIVASLLVGTVETQNAVANGDTRTLSLIHEHTKESGSFTFKVNGRYDRAALDQLNWLLRDWRENESTRMDPRLFDVVWEAQRSLGSTQPLRVISAFRSPRTNGMLRRRSSGVAEHSQHTLGKAMDFYLTDATVDDIRAAGIRMQRGGVGWYPRSGSPFVHLDVGSVRAWPRMSGDQLARLFPDGKTVHLPASGKPLPRYEEAKTEILARGGTVRGHTAVASADAYDDGPSLGRFFAGLLRGGSSTAPSAAPAPTGTARAPATVAVASADPGAAIGVKQALAFAAPNSTEALRDTMLRRDGGEQLSARALLTAEPSALAAVRTAPAVTAPLPPRRPSELASVDAAISMPLPPSRPIQLASLDEAVPGMANASASDEGPDDGADEAPSRLVPAQADSQEQLRGLFRTVAQDASEPSRRDAPVHVALMQVRQDPVPATLLTQASGAGATRFQPHSPGDDLAASRFSGSATSAVQLRR